MARCESTFGTMAQPNKEAYKALCDRNKDIPFFLRHGWISRVLDDHNWDVVLHQKGSEVLGFMPLHVKSKGPLKWATMPPLTPYLGPWALYPKGQKTPAKVGFEVEVFTQLANQIGHLNKATFYTHPSVNNLLPFQWAGLTTSVRYTYIIGEFGNTEALWNGLQGNIRQEIKKARETIAVTEVDDAIELFLLKSLQPKAHSGVNFNQAYYEKVISALHYLGDWKCLRATTSSGQTAAMAIFPFDADMGYYLAGAIHPDHRTTGALSLLLWTAMEHLTEKTRAFNFEGGMKPNIERYFRGFGAVPVPYAEVGRPLIKPLL